jgi:hypothetical protein
VINCGSGSAISPHRTAGIRSRSPGRVRPSSRTRRTPISSGCRSTARWGLPKEDFLHYIATGHAKMGRRGQRSDARASPSCTRQEPYVQAITMLLGGMDAPEVKAVRAVQEGSECPKHEEGSGGENDPGTPPQPRGSNI